MFKQLRKEKGYTQASLAVALGLNQSTISSWENRITTPSVKTTIKIADLFDVDVGDIVSCFKDDKKEV